MARLDTERQQRLEPKRAKKAEIEILNAGCVILNSTTDKRIDFIFETFKCSYFPYSGWATGRTIIDGRGLENLLKQIKK